MAWVYLSWHETKGVPASHTLFLNPAEHVGSRNVPSAWCEKNDAGRIVGKPMTIQFINGRFDADERLADYLVQNNFASRTPCRPPPLPWEDDDGVE